MGDYVASGCWVSFRLWCCDYARLNIFFYLFIFGKVDWIMRRCTKGGQIVSKFDAILGFVRQFNRTNVLSNCIEICLNFYATFLKEIIYKFQNPWYNIYCKWVINNFLFWEKEFEKYFKKVFTNSKKYDIINKKLRNENFKK